MKDCNCASRQSSPPKKITLVLIGQWLAIEVTALGYQFLGLAGAILVELELLPNTIFSIKYMGHPSVNNTTSEGAVQRRLLRLSNTD